MNYTLLNKLRKAGWKFRKVFSDSLPMAIPTGTRIVQYLNARINIVKFKDEWFWVPILEELINEVQKLNDCGDFHLESLYDEWQTSVCYITTKNGDKVWDDWINGKTKYEAIIDLWIKLRVVVEKN